MKTLLRVIAFIVLVALGVVPAWAADPPPLPGPGVTVLHLTARAERMLARDRLSATLTVEVTAASPQQVQAEINKRMTAALARVHQVASVKPETGGYSVYQDRQPNQPVQWHGRQTLILASDNSSELLSLVGDLQQQGLSTGGLSYDLSPVTARKAEDELTAQALKELRERAEKVASGLGLSVQQIRDVTVGNVETNGPRPPVPMGVMRAQAAAAPPVAEAGDTTVAVTVDANFWLLSRGQ